MVHAHRTQNTWRESSQRWAFTSLNQPGTRPTTHLQGPNLQRHITVLQVQGVRELSEPETHLIVQQDLAFTTCPTYSIFRGDCHLRCEDAYSTILILIDSLTQQPKCQQRPKPRAAGQLSCTGVRGEKGVGGLVLILPQDVSGPSFLSFSILGEWIHS